jgi:hypothetical protein
MQRQADILDVDAGRQDLSEGADEWLDEVSVFEFGVKSMTFRGGTIPASVVAV